MTEEKDTFYVQTCDGRQIVIAYKITYNIIKDDVYNLVYSVNDMISSHAAWKTSKFKGHFGEVDLAHLKDMLKCEICNHLSENHICVIQFEYNLKYNLKCN